MRIEAIKLDLAKKLIETDKREIIGYKKAIFESHPSNWFEDLPADIQESLERGLAQSKRGEGRPHAELRKKHEKWLK
jgi:hypothetical protein